MNERFAAWQGSATAKALFIGLLVLLLLVPLGMVKELVLERMSLYAAARDEVAGSWGHAQTLGGPILIVPFHYTRWIQGQSVTARDELYVGSDELEVTGTLTTEQRWRGIYRVPVYSADLHVSGRFATPVVGDSYEDLEVLWSEAQIALPLTDARSVKAPIELTAGLGTATFHASGERVPGFGAQLLAAAAALQFDAAATPRDFSFDVAIRGTGGIRFLPLAQQTRVHLTSNWASPSFRGAYLPDPSPAVDGNGFAADWRVLDLGRGYSASFKRSDQAPLSADVAASAFGADLIMPIGVHETTLRATKHAVLILALTFTAFFLFEICASLRLHALQYLLIGLANCTFYLLLLALAEHVPYGWAYLASAAAATTLIVAYSAAVLSSARRALPIGALLTALYGFLYVTLRAEDYALLLGALGVFATLAMLMYLTRHIDWSAAGLRAGRRFVSPATSASAESGT
jgi:inner membrane protein